MQKGRIKLNAVERKYIVVALQSMLLEYNHRFSHEERILYKHLIRKINSGIRYEANNRPNRS